MPRAPEPPRPGTLLRSPALALAEADFAPLAEPARHDLARRMNAWGRIVAERLRAAGLELTLRQASEVASDSGSLRVVFAADEHGALELRADPSDIRAGLVLPFDRARAVRSELSNPARALELATALEALPEQFVAGVDGDAAMVAAPRCAAEDVRALLDRAESERRPLWIGWTVSRDVAVEHSELLDEQLEDALVALVGVFAIFAGAADDAAALPRRGHGSWPRHDSARAEEDRGRTKKRARETSQRQARDGGRDRPGHREADGDGERDASTEARHPAKEPGSRPADSLLSSHAATRRRPAALAAKAPGRAGSRARVAASIERGARVRVLEGPFSGKVGTVHELDGKGGARVMLGLLAVRLDVTNLAVHDVGRRRPVLGTSHRKPVPVRS